MNGDGGLYLQNQGKRICDLGEINPEGDLIAVLPQMGLDSFFVYVTSGESTIKTEVPVFEGLTQSMPKPRVTQARFRVSASPGQRTLTPSERIFWAVVERHPMPVIGRYRWINRNDIQDDDKYSRITTFDNRYGPGHELCFTNRVFRIRPGSDLLNYINRTIPSR